MTSLVKPLGLVSLQGGVMKRTVPTSTAGAHAAVIVGSPATSVKSEPGMTRILVEERGSVLVDNTGGGDLSRCKRRINFAYSQPVPGHQPASVARRNARERNRVKQVNNGFATLRSHIPLSVAAALGAPAASRGSAASKKLSKVETLKMAVEYIRSLQDLLDENGQPARGESQFYERGRSPAASDHQHQHQHQHQRPPPESSLSPPCSEASSSPPPSSYASEGSYPTGPSLAYHEHDRRDNYDPMSPEDEELLDVISWWQQSQ